MKTFLLSFSLFSLTYTGLWAMGHPLQPQPSDLKPAFAPPPVTPPAPAPAPTPVSTPAPSPTPHPAALAVAPAAPAPENDSTPVLLPPTPLSAEAAAEVNASARGLAGLSGGSSWESSSTWHEHSTYLDGMYNRLDRLRLTEMRTWNEQALGSLHDRTSTVFYPFSGPDVLYADTLFPHSKILLMAGLEPVGTMPHLEKLQQDGKLDAYLQEIKTSLFTVLAASFFKTKDMKTQLNNPLVDGLTPVLAVFLARQGCDLASIDEVTLSRSGHVVARGSRSGDPGVEITYFRHGQNDDLRTLLYFSTDLSDEGQQWNPGYTRLMAHLAPGVTYLKAASYLLHEGYFSTIRNAILQNSAGVVEDDSGLPFRSFDLKAWDLVPYGNYTGPIELFKKYDQPDLRDYFAHTSHAALPFGSGYKFNTRESSLLVALKKS